MDFVVRKATLNDAKDANKLIFLNLIIWTGATKSDTKGTYIMK